MFHTILQMSLAQFEFCVKAFLLKHPSKL